MRGGLDDALERLARRDRMRRRSGRYPDGPPRAVVELAEALASVVRRNPELTLTVGVEGAGSPVLLHVAMADGLVRVTAGDPPDVVGADAQEPYPVDVDYDHDAEIHDAEEVTHVPPPAQPPAEPVPLRVEQPEETEMAARRVAALLREDPTLLQ